MACAAQAERGIGSGVRTWRPYLGRQRRTGLRAVCSKRSPDGGVGSSRGIPSALVVASHISKAPPINVRTSYEETHRCWRVGGLRLSSSVDQKLQLSCGRRRSGPTARTAHLARSSERRTMRKADIDRVVAQLRSAEAAYEEARRQRDEAVIKMARVDGLNNREIAARVELTAERVAQILKKGG